MFKLFKSLRINNHGEVASMLTIVSFLLLAAGTILGSSIAQRETRTVSKAAGYHWNECQIGVCNANFDGRTDDNGWCQAAGVRCQRYNGKVCQLPDPWCDSPNQGAATTCTGVHQKGFDNTQTCSTASYTPGNGNCEPPNENWETNLDCPWTLPGTGGGAQPPAGGNQTQCVNEGEGGFCSQSTDACNNTQGHAPDPTQPKDCSGSLPVCCKPWNIIPTPTPTPTLPPGTKTISGTVTVYFTQKTFTEIMVNAEQGGMAQSPQSSFILGTTVNVKKWSANEVSSGIPLQYSFSYQDPQNIKNYKITVGTTRNVDVRKPTLKAACKNGAYTDNKDFCDDLHSGDTANFIIDFGSDQALVTNGTISGKVDIIPLEGYTITRIYILGEKDVSKVSNGWDILQNITNHATYPISNYNDNTSLNNGDKIYLGLFVEYTDTNNNPSIAYIPASFDKSYKTTTPVLVPQSNLNFTGRIPPDQGPVAQLPPNALQFGFTAPEYKQVIDGYISGAYSALQISEWVSRATNSPGIKIKFCDPMKGECDIPF